VIPVWREPEAVLHPWEDRGGCVNVANQRVRRLSTVIVADGLVAFLIGSRNTAPNRLIEGRLPVVL
jgi:hypothetical protein